MKTTTKVSKVLGSLLAGIGSFVAIKYLILGVFGNYISGVIFIIIGILLFFDMLGDW